MNGQAFFVVGHSNWGKSKTLLSLAGPHQVRKWSLVHRTFFLRRMSNDDKPKDWAVAVDALEPAQRPYVIIALCPKQGAEPSLRKLARTYDLFFWVMRHPFIGNGIVDDEQVAFLRTFGVVEVFERKVDAQARAASLTKFILKNAPRARSCG